MYTNCKCGVCGGENVVITYVSDTIEPLFIEEDGRLVFCSPPYEDNDLSLEDLKEDVISNDDYDVYFSCYDCEDEADFASIFINGVKYTDAKKAFLKLIK